MHLRFLLNWISFGKSASINAARNSSWPLDMLVKLALGVRQGVLPKDLVPWIKCLYDNANAPARNSLHSISVWIQPFTDATMKTWHDACFMISGTFTRSPFPFTTQKISTAGLIILSRLFLRRRGNSGICLNSKGQGALLLIWFRGQAPELRLHANYAAKTISVLYISPNTIFSPIEPPGGKAVVWGACIRNNTKMAISRPKMVQFSFCKKDFEGKIVLYHLRI